jgi:hypothetical protein
VSGLDDSRAARLRFVRTMADDRRHFRPTRLVTVRYHWTRIQTMGLRPWFYDLLADKLQSAAYRAEKVRRQIHAAQLRQERATASAPPREPFAAVEDVPRDMTFNPFAEDDE